MDAGVQVLLCMLAHTKHSPVEAFRARTHEDSATLHASVALTPAIAEPVDDVKRCTIRAASAGVAA